MASRITIYLMFFLSGLSALVYQVLWVRSFSLIFGGSHMAVTTVLSVFMGGLALGGYLGRHIDRNSRPLKVYGWAEIGIGAAAILLLWLLQVYPDLYISFAHLIDNNLAGLTIGRMIFAILALLLPTTLMGITLPALAGFATRRGGELGKHLGWLYGINTLGAVAGALAAGFFLLRYLTVPMTYGLAIVISILVGIVSLVIERKSDEKMPAEAAPGPDFSNGKPALNDREDPHSVPVRLILFGIGISGFCALGYEVLWTRVLSLVVGTTVYGYTLMLVAFLIGIAIGGASYRLFLKLFRIEKTHGAVLSFGLIQVVIGILALLVTYGLRDLTNQALDIENTLVAWFGQGVGVLKATNFIMALLYMLPPAFFMGLSFPLAGDIVGRGRRKVGRAVGETLTYNTVGAILGAAVSGFILLYLFGIERSLQYLTLVNLALGLTVCARLLPFRPLAWGIAPAAFLIMVAFYLQPDLMRIWDSKYFATFNHDDRRFITSKEKRQDLYEITDVLYYAEGVTSTISVVKVKGANQGLNVNGRTVASDARQDQQCQYTLGHLPMLLHPNPEKVWVLGMGTGMTAGATTVHPEVESVTIAELERHVLPAARTFAEYNHDFLDDPKVEVVFNDGRNFLLTTEERYDVITADPIHPWSQGSAYLYTDEYYRLAANRLNKGGVMCQWLPIYELSPMDLKSVVRTFANNFAYVYVWLTDYDAELLGSNEPIEIDIDAIQKRLEAAPEVLSDLKRVNMGSAAKFLSYGIMGPAGSREYGKGAPLNTDDNLYLEFSAPDSRGKAEMNAINIASLSGHREDITPYIKGMSIPEKLNTNAADFRRAAIIYDRAHLMWYQSRSREPAYAFLMQTLDDSYPWFAPGQFLVDEYKVARKRIPQLVDQMSLRLMRQDGSPINMTLSSVSSLISPERVKLMIVDNRARKIFGHIYIDGKEGNMERLVEFHSDRLLDRIDRVYQEETVSGTLPPVDLTIDRIKEVIDVYEPEETRDMSEGMLQSKVE